MNEQPIARARVAEANAISRRIPEVLERRGLDPVFSQWMLTQDQRLTWLFGVLDVQRIQRLESYGTDDLLHHLSTAIGGRPVYLSNHSGLRYAILLSSPPRLPRRADFPGFERGMVQLGQRAAGDRLAVPWSRLGHLLVAGKTGSGKSAFLRLVTYQAVLEGYALLLADVDGATFPMLEHHPALLQPIAHSPEAALSVVEKALEACNARASLYRQAGGYPEKLEEYNTQAVAAGAEPLPPILVILDEFNATVTAAGGAKGALANAAAELGWRGRKFGISLIFAAQDFSKGVVGRVRDQVGAIFGFQVRSTEVAQAIGIPEAVRIPESRSGLAVTDRWGPVQTFWLDKRRLVELADTPAPAEALTAAERVLVEWAIDERRGYLTLPDIQAHLQIGPSPARRLADAWELRGWLRKDPTANNARKIAAPLQALAGRPTDPTDGVRPQQIGEPK